MAAALKQNSTLRKCEIEANNLGPRAAAAFGSVFETNVTLKSVNLEANNLTLSGQDSSGVEALAAALASRTSSLEVLNLARNNLGPAAGDALCSILL